jgi:PAS domain S-box-containing protein
MNVDDFGKKAKKPRTRSAAENKYDELWLNASQHSDALPEVGREEPLHVAYEELQVAEEELRAQTEELADARQTLEDERQRYRDLFEFAPDGYIVTDQYGAIQEANHAATAMLRVTQQYVTHKLLVVFIAADRRDFRTRLAHLPTSNKVQQWEVRLQPRQGTPIDVSLRVGAVRNSAGETVALRWLLNDITERKQAEANIRQRNQELEILNTITSAISTTLDLSTVLSTLSTLLLERLEIQGGAVFFREEKGTDLILQAHWGLPSKVLGDLVDSACPRADKRQLDALEDLATAHARAVSNLIASRADLAWTDWQSYECVNLVADGKVRGFIDLFHHRPRTFSHEQRVFFSILGQQVGVAVKNAQLFEQVTSGREQLAMVSRRLVEVQEQERRRVARELHDEIGQALTGLRICLEAGQYLPQDVARQRLQEALKLANELIGQVREMSLDLRPAMLDDLGLLAALRWHFRRYTSQTGIKVSFYYSGLEGRFAGELETAVYRIVQEALTNVARYAQVDKVEVKICAEPNVLLLDVTDFGVGFEPAKLTMGSSSGLAGMRERAALLGGRLVIKSARGAGCQLIAELPLNPESSPTNREQS